MYSSNFGFGTESVDDDNNNLHMKFARLREIQKLLAKEFRSEIPDKLVEASSCHAKWMKIWRELTQIGDYFPIEVGQIKRTYNFEKLFSDLDAKLQTFHASTKLKSPSELKEAKFSDNTKTTALPAVTKTAPIAAKKRRRALSVHSTLQPISTPIAAGFPEIKDAKQQNVAAQSSPNSAKKRQVCLRTNFLTFKVEEAKKAAANAPVVQRKVGILDRIKSLVS